MCCEFISCQPLGGKRGVEKGGGVEDGARQLTK